MNIYELLYYCVIGNLEYLFIGFCIYGLKRRSFVMNIIALVMSGSIGYLCSLANVEKLFVHLIWIYVLYALFYRLRWNQLIRYASITFLLINAADAVFIGFVK